MILPLLRGTRELKAEAAGANLFDLRGELPSDGQTSTSRSTPLADLATACASRGYRERGPYARACHFQAMDACVASSGYLNA